MPFAPYIARSVLRSAVGVFARAASDYSRGLRASRAPSTEWVRNWIMREYGHNPGAHHSTAMALARRAQQAFEGAAHMRRHPGAVPSASRHGADPGIARGEEEYRYEIVVIRRDDAGNVVSFASELRSDVPMSAAQIEAHVRQHIGAHGSPRPETRRRIAALGNEVPPEVIVTAAFRRDR